MSGFLGVPDRWSFTTGGRIWIDQSWLSHAIYYLWFLALDDLGPVLVQGILLVCCLLLLFLRCRALGASVQAAFIATTLGALSFAPFLGIRAENFGMVYAVLMIGILSAPDSWGRWREGGALLILAIWSNSHGSFMLGFVLVCARFLLDVHFSVKSVRQLLPSGTSPRATGNDAEANTDSEFQRPVFGKACRTPDVMGWLITVVFALAVMAFLNPYGLENLRMPFRQLSASSITAQWVDWLPLIETSTMFDRGLLKPLSVAPFLVLLTVVVILVAVLPFTVGIRRVAEFTVLRAKSCLAMEIAAAIVLLPLVFRFRRMMLFAAPALVPVLALLLQVYVDAIRTRLGGAAGTPKVSRKLIAGIASFAWLLVLFFLFYTCTVVPHASSNPLASSQDRPLVSRLMSYDMVWTDVARFLIDNRIEGKVFSNVLASDYLLFNVPGIRLFFDLRAQSAYSDRIIRAYVSIMTDLNRGTELLDDYDVEVVVLDTFSDAALAEKYYAVAVRLMESKKWVCVYRDHWVFVLVRSDSERFRSVVGNGDLAEFRFASEETKVMSRAFLSWFTKGRLTDELVREVQEVLQREPDPHLYRLEIAALNGTSRCLNARAVSFALSEIQRLSGADFMIAGGSSTILKSLWDILNILEHNENTCGSEARAALFRNEKHRVRELFETIRSKYDGL